MKAEKWTVEALSRYLWEHNKEESCEGCRLANKCAVGFPDCSDFAEMLKTFGIEADA